MKPIRMLPEYQVLETAIRPQDVATVAEELGKSEDTIYRWRRRPNSVDDENGTGRRSPLTEFLRLVRAVYHANPEGADQLVDKVRDELHRLRGTAREPLTEEQLIAVAEATRTNLNHFIAALRQERK